MFEENNFYYTHSLTQSTRPVVARCILTFMIQIFYKGGILIIIPNACLFSVKSVSFFNIFQYCLNYHFVETQVCKYNYKKEKNIYLQACLYKEEITLVHLDSNLAPTGFNGEYYTSMALQNQTVFQKQNTT